MLILIKPWALALYIFTTFAITNYAIASSVDELSDTRKSQLLNLIRQDCGSCHGMTLKGGLGKPLLPKALEGKPHSNLMQIILDGIPNTPMPPWRELLSESDVNWIVTQLKNGIEK